MQLGTNGGAKRRAPGHGSQPSEHRAGESSASSYNGSRFRDVWNTVAHDPYLVLPTERVSLGSMGRWLKDAALARAAQRTLESRADLLPPFAKLVHPYGTCLWGWWKITGETPYSGYFASGREALIIARASDALNETRRGKLRFLGLAGKLYPTSDPEHSQPLETANFFVFENLGGSHTSRFSQGSYANDLLPLLPHPGVARYAPLMTVVGPAFALADGALNPTQAMIRQLYPIAELGENDKAAARGPRFMRLVGREQGHAPLSWDLREELTMDHYPAGLRFEIQVASGPRLLPKVWHPIGELHFVESVASEAGDTRLHFAHPRYFPGRAEL